MNTDRLASPLQGGYEISVEEVNGRRVVRARYIHPDTGLRVTLTFPADPAGDDLERFKARLVRLILKQRLKKQDTA